MELSPYLNFNGNCKEAMTFYATLLNGELTIMTAADTPMAEEMPEAKDMVMHSEVKFDGMTLMGSDAFGNEVKPQGFSVMLNVPTAGDAERLFAALSDGGNVTTPIEETFWAERFGEVTDRFGTPWAINCSKPM